MYWAKWSALCKPKERGGMGFRDIRSFNRALLAKQIWRMEANPQSLVSSVFKASYFKHGDLRTARVTSNASFIWISLAWSRDLIEQGSAWRVGDGRKISVWGDKWVAGWAGTITDSGVGPGGAEMKVRDLMVSGMW